MTEFDETALAWMRQMLIPSLPDRATLYIPIYSPDDGGGHAVTWQMIATDVPCRMVRVNRHIDAWTSLGDVLHITPIYRAVLMYDAPIRADMRVVIAGAAYRIVQFSDAHHPKLMTHIILATE